MVDNENKPPDIILFESERNEHISIMLSKMDKKQKKVIEMSMGFDPYHKQYTEKSISKELGIARQQVSYLKAKAIRYLRHPDRAKILRDFL